MSLNCAHYVYMMASKRNGVIYIGMAENLKRRVRSHKGGYGSRFSQKYFVKKIVYFEKLDSYETALRREKQMKKWKRDWKIELIEKLNPNWIDLYEKL